MTTVFIAGSITIKKIDDLVKDRIANILDAGHRIIVGDADGADKAVQDHLALDGRARVTIYCSGERPRNNSGLWPVEKIDTDAKPGTRAFFTAKDLKMAQVADFGLMIWDSKSTGTLSNVIELTGRGKKSLVYISKAKEFCSIGSASHIDKLVSVMSGIARENAESKINLSRKIEQLKNAQSGFDF
ncbi:hypothetical protein [Stenotrophomonas indicatrix]|uniref:hypothetical protein n=1 Tax=Stenotrophomonas indicatrix TaxID=2045451 RepID=UPI0032083B2D